ncbi:senescence-associated protein SPA15, chloroplastic isoform X2 [Apium graveolens]|uniref:senescence-associated protein SPA15, chloroplastic isoform X2 n=1 Tax=Apium graveolens TaxID=4045 RepID=UPI003D7A4BFE
MAKSPGIINLSAKSPQHPGLYGSSQGTDLRKQINGHFSMLKTNFSDKGLWHICRKLRTSKTSKKSSLLCQSTETHSPETKQSVKHLEDCSSILSEELDEEQYPVMQGRIVHSKQALAEAMKFAYNDAKFVNERARNDIVLLSRGLMRLDARARQDVSIIGSEFIKLDARAREDTDKIDQDVKRRAEHLHHIAIILKNKAQSRLRKAADKHWSDGALELESHIDIEVLLSERHTAEVANADLRRADLIAKQRARDDAVMALEFIKDIHDMMVSKMYTLSKGSLSANEMAGRITLEKNGISLDFFPGEVSSDRITAIQEAYRDIASGLSEDDGVDYSDPEELELLVATLIDLDAMDGKSSVSLLAECSSSPNVDTRKALANALSAAPSMWTLGNAGMGALRRLAEDSNPAIAAAASKTMLALKKQWQIQEGDSWRFVMDQKLMIDSDKKEEDDR